MNSVEFARKAKQYLKTSTPSVLDCGCGNGSVTLDMENCLVKAFDIDNTKVAELQFKIKELQKQNTIKVVEGNVLDFNYKEKSCGWDLVICTNVLHYLPDHSALKALKNIINSVSKNGILAFSYLMDEKGLPDSIATTLVKNLDTIEMQCKKVFDKGHKGNPEPHTHMVFYFIGKKS